MFSVNTFSIEKVLHAKDRKASVLVKKISSHEARKARIYMCSFSLIAILHCNDIDNVVE